jgi:secreted trypsin-like serine protease
MRSLIALAGATVLAAFAATAAPAITYGTADGNLHPYVGGIVEQDRSSVWFGTPYCSGSLVAPTVFVTAAHCGGSDRVPVSFASTIEPGSKLHWGTWHQHPSYYSGEDNPHDVAVVVLDKPVKGATARIAPLGLLDDMKASGTLDRRTAFTSVGYGAQETTKPHGWGAPGPSFTYLDTREWATGYFNALGKGYLTISQNINTGSGGTCYGDSGGPQFLGGADSNLQVSVTVSGDMFCKSTNKAQRLDIFSVQSWLAQFGAIR